MHIGESPVKAQLRGASSGGTGPDLTGFPHLVYAPAQCGEGVRCGSNGASAMDVAEEAAVMPIEKVATFHHISLHEALDALRYARATRLI
jgi:hypothetical protein